MSRNVKISFISFFISFTVLFPVGVFGAIHFIDSNRSDAKPVEASPAFVIPKEQDINILLTVCRKNPEPADVYVVVKISAHSNSVSIASLQADTVTIVNTKQGSLKELYDWGGIECVKQAVENVMFITIDRTIKADNNAVLSVIDKLGGVEMTLIEDVNYENISLPSGRQFLDGARFCAALRGEPVNSILALGGDFTSRTDISSTFAYVANLCNTNISAYDIELRKSGWEQMIQQKNAEIIIPDVEFETVNKRQRLTSSSKEQCVKAFTKE